ncbi:DUF2306 domain-containing protein [Donghicola mangrovi]|uniref:DUF2306 domain-containing protein n=1 Tax=Donghicola mangrovi TaxID=2729614 RepID=A0A850Q7R9_9RHOB|nr:DUF2306 domain-containing protein [Donghicola mangrovi]NVO24252.1 DUF2306 domain-containing protein [Donghicola mangrovi]
MSISALTSAAPAIQIHAYAALLAVVLTILIFTRARGTMTHRVLGWVWVLLMGFTAISSFAISTLRPGHFSVIHILSIATLILLVLGVYRARTHQVKKHRQSMLGLVFGALCVAGAFTLLPNRIMHAVLFGQ